MGQTSHIEYNTPQYAFYQFFTYKDLRKLC